jgi:hypothetical protein
MNSTFSRYQYINIVWFCSNFFAMSNSCYNPFIYAIYNEKFKREYRQRFGRWLGYTDHRTYGYGEKTTSIHTRASSLRSNYPSSSVRFKHDTLGMCKFGREPTNFNQLRKAAKTTSNVASPTSDNAELSSSNNTYRCNCFSQSVKPESDDPLEAKQKGSASKKATRNSAELIQTQNVNYCDDCQCHHHQYPHPNNRKLSAVKYRRTKNGNFIWRACDQENAASAKPEPDDNETLTSGSGEGGGKHHNDCMFYVKSDEAETLM